MHIFVVYCHPDDTSFTAKIGINFIRGLEAAGHTYEISDLYAMKFRNVITRDEYKREGYYDKTAEVPKDVISEQRKINLADAMVFIYPVFWSEAPAMLTGWFQRVFTYGFAYGEKVTMKKLEKALFLVTMGADAKDKDSLAKVEAMKTVMLKDRISDRVKYSEMILFDKMSRQGDAEERDKRADKFMAQAYEIGKNIALPEKTSDENNDDNDK